MKKICIEINEKNNENIEEYIFYIKYGDKSHEVNLKISKDYAMITYFVSKIDIESIKKCNSYYFKCILKKLMLLHIFKYRKNINIDFLTINSENINNIKINFNQINIYTLLYNNKIKKIYDFENKENYNKLLNLDNDNLLSSIYAYLCGCDRENETEKFIYYWMSVNGIYNYFSKKDNIEKNDRYGLKKLHCILNNNNDIKKYNIPDDDKILMYVISLFEKFDIKKLTEKSLNEKCNKGFCNELVNFLNENCKEYRGTLFQFLSIYLGYYYRCNIFHANKPINFFYFETKNEIEHKSELKNYNCFTVKNLTIMNDLLYDLIKDCYKILFDKYL